MSIFQKIIDREIPAEIVHEDEWSLAFRDINPQAPVHILIIPKRPVASLAELADEDQTLAGHLILVIRKVAEQLGLQDDGYRVVTNCGRDGGQEVPHLHFHLLGGRRLQWPPG